MSTRTRLEFSAQIQFSRDRARMQQRLVLPGPGFLFLVFDEGADPRDQHAALARGPQAHVDFVKPPGRRVHGQDVQRALREADEKHLVVDRLRRVGLGLFRARVVQEYQVQVRGIAQLEAA